MLAGGSSAVWEKQFSFLTSLFIMLRISLRVNLEMLRKPFLLIISTPPPRSFGRPLTCDNFCWGYCCIYHSWWLVCTFSFCYSSKGFKPVLLTTKPPWAMCLQPSRSPLFMLHLQQSQKEIMSNLFTWFSTKMQPISVLLRAQAFLTALFAQHKEFIAKKKGLSEGCFPTPCIQVLLKTTYNLQKSLAIFYYFLFRSVKKYFKVHIWTDHRFTATGSL